MQAGQGKWSVRGWPLAATSTGRGEERERIMCLGWTKVMGESHARGVEVTAQARKLIFTLKKKLLFIREEDASHRHRKE